MELQKPYSEGELLQSSGNPPLEDELLQSSGNPPLEDELLQSSPSHPKKGCLRCVTPKKCSVWGCCPGTFPSESPSGESPTQGMSLHERILHVGGKDDGKVEFGSVQEVHALISYLIRDRDDALRTQGVR